MEVGVAKSSFDVIGTLDWSSQRIRPSSLPRRLPLSVRSDHRNLVHKAVNDFGASLSFQSSPPPRWASRQVRAAAAAVAEPDMATFDAPVVQTLPPAGQSIAIDIVNSDNVTKLIITGPPDKNMMGKITNAICSLEHRNIQGSRNEGQKDGLQKCIFMLQNDQEQEIPVNEHPGLRTGLLVALGLTTGESMLPNIHDQPMPIPDASQAAQEAWAKVAYVSGEMTQVSAALATLTLQRDRHVQNGDLHLASETEKEIELKSQEFTRIDQMMQACKAALYRPQLAAEPAVEEQGGELMAQEQNIKRKASGPALGNGFEVFLQGFNWESCKKDWYQVLMGQVEQIKEAGFTSVWLPPPSNSVSPQGYLPRDLDDLNSAYGSEYELRELCATLNNAGIKPVADIVINHRCAHKQDAQGRWNQFGGRFQWGPWAICAGNPEFGGTGNAKRGEDYHAAPNVDHANPQVKADIATFFQRLKSVGFRGWRLDYVKGYSGTFIEEYILALKEHAPELAFGEYWDTCSYTNGVLNYDQNAHRQRIVDWIDATNGMAGAFDFTTKGILQEAVAKKEYWRLVDPQGQPAGMMGMWSSRAVTFIENHDTGSTLNHWPFPANGLFEGYAYILTHPGSPCVFYDHFFYNQPLQDAITKLLKVRKENYISARSLVRVQKAESEVYAAVIGDVTGVGQMEKDKCFLPRIAVKVGPGDWSPQTQQHFQYGGHHLAPKTWELSCSGPNFAVWKAVFVDEK